MAESEEKKQSDNELKQNEFQGKDPDEFKDEVIEGASVKDDAESSEAAVPVEEYDALQEQLEETRRKAAENFEGWQRERADFLNYKKRIERDQILVSQQIKGEIIRNYLQVLDDLELALKAMPKEGAGAEWAQGVELVYRKLRNILEAEGVKRIEADNQIFDPTVHEAISNEESPEHESGEIIEVVQQGYMIGDRVLRPAKVRVAR